MTRFPPIVNATLTRVQGGGGAEDYDATASTGADKWSGAAAVLVSDQEVSQDGQDSSIVVERTVAVDDALDVEWARGDLLTYVYRGDTLTGTARDVKTTTGNGLPGVVRLVLRDA